MIQTGEFHTNNHEHELKLQEIMRKTIARAHEQHDYGTMQVLEEVLLDMEDLVSTLLEDDTHYALD